MPKLPSLQFYPGDWLRDSVAGCSLAAQGLWLRMMLVMHDSARYGYLCNLDGSLIPPESVARRCGCTPEQYEALLHELDVSGVPSRTTEGVIYSRRMVRDAEKRVKDADRQAKYRDEGAQVPDAGLKRADNPLSHVSVTSLSQPSSSSSSTSNSNQERAPLPFRKSAKEKQTDLELRVGEGPRPADLGVRVNPAALERIRKRVGGVE